MVANEPVSAVARRLFLDVPGWSGHVPGQHVDVRLTAEDGYSVQRSYSIASAPEAGGISLVVQRVADGEVSPYLVDELRQGDQLELRGPIGGYFVWDASTPAPLQLIAGGSGVAPFLAMLDHHEAASASAPARLLYSVRSLEDVIAADRLEEHAQRGVGVVLALTRAAPPGWSGLRGRVTAEALRRAVWSAAVGPEVMICGPTAFVETMADLLLAQGHPAEHIKTERFG